MATITVDLPALHAGQRAVRQPGHRFRILRCGRRWGKTVLAAIMCIEVALGIAPWHHRCNNKSGTPQPGRAWWVPPTYKLARIGWRVLNGLARALQKAGLPVEILKGDMTIVFPGGGEVVVRSADSPAGLRGDGLDFVVVEEAAYVAPDAWHEALRPALADRKGEALFITTPAGFNWFWELEQTAVSLGWLVIHQPTSANPHIAPDEIDDMRAEMGSLAFTQEVMAEYVADGTNPFSPSWFKHYRLTHQPEAGSSTDPASGWYVTSPPSESGETRTYHLADLPRFVTVDPAISMKTTADYTVIATVALTPHGDLVVVDIDRDRIPSPDLVQRIRASMERWGASWCAIESVAYQTSIVEHALRAGLPARPLKADRDKLTRAQPLIVKTEAGKVWFRHDADWLRPLELELTAFRGLGDDAHDDQVDALAYAAIESMRIPDYAVN